MFFIFIMLKIEIDLKNPKTNLRTAGYTIEERNSFNLILEKQYLANSRLHETMQKLLSF